MKSLRLFPLARLVLGIALSVSLFLSWQFPAIALTQEEACSAIIYCYQAEYLSNYDGDTISVNIDLGLQVHVNDIDLRLYGIDTPEVRGTEKEAGLVVRNYVRDRLNGQPIVVQTIQDKKDKYGRLLTVIWVDKTNLNEELLQKGFAVEY